MPSATTYRKALGQHYLADASIVDLMIRIANIRKDERVIEIGTGRGVLTRGLCEVASSVEGFEVDPENYSITKRLGLRGLMLRHENPLRRQREFDVLVSSLPYSESSRFIEWLAKSQYNRAVVLMQSAFAEKLLAVPGDDKYRAISVISQISSDVRIIRRVARESFNPKPMVLSALVIITRRCTLTDEQIRTINLLFSQRKRNLSTALRNLGLQMVKGTEDVTRRVETLSADEIDDVLVRITHRETI